MIDSSSPVFLTISFRHQIFNHQDAHQLFFCEEHIWPYWQFLSMCWQVHSQTNISYRKCDSLNCLRLLTFQLGFLGYYLILLMFSMSWMTRIKTVLGNCKNIKFQSKDGIVTSAQCWSPSRSRCIDGLNNERWYHSITALGRDQKHILVKERVF